MILTLRKPGTVRRRIHRMTKAQLYRFCVEQRVNVPFAYRTLFKDRLLPKALLIEIVEDAIEVAPTIYGCSSVNIEKRPDLCLWEVYPLNSDRKLCNVPWRNIYEDRELSPQNRAALMACLVAEPLGPEDEEELFHRFPNLQGLEPFEVDEAWALWEREEDEPEPPPGRPQEPLAEVADEPSPEPRQLSLKRKISI